MHIVNVYAPQRLPEKKNLWDALENLKLSTPGIWVLCGDFNAVRLQEERKNTVFNTGCARNFNDFIHNSRLLEYQMKGSKFTYARRSGAKMSKIDRFLICQDFFDLWHDTCLMALPRYLSDHSPLILIIVPIDFGPIPFRFFLILGWTGPPDLYLIEKLRHIKSALKLWINDIKVKEEDTFNSLSSDIQNLEIILETRELLAEEQWTYEECKAGLRELEDHKNKDVRQRSRAKWASYGDDNSAYFHRVIKNKNARNRIHDIKMNGGWRGGERYANPFLVGLLDITTTAQKPLPELIQHREGQRKTHRKTGGSGWMTSRKRSRWPR
ncbi:hypothetical protein QVD17_20642 [Tagetes erecta]|uniref:Endonuclease/exonuclease/phosphatase domain-containing protein n=1 Tax=Tagetes erecta TaxID=13708 RepID=A0AAD8KQA6_TARER|nr:hypothetical protein QVD17_20642 [Tagetes erecta]